MSTEVLSADTEVILLLCGRFGGEKQEAYPPLSTSEYGELAKWLKKQNVYPSQLLTAKGRDALSGVVEARLERKRVEFLLGRGTAMALALERWARGGIWVISRGDVAYPQRLKRRLKHSAPPLLYGAGDKALLEKGGVAIVGSRDVTASGEAFTRAIAARCANEGLTVVSGGARGVDAAAMQGATEAGGFCIGVLPSDLLKTSLNRQNRIGLQEGRLVLVSPFYPEAGFGRGANAMARNRYIYTLADQALVIDSALEGGTWTGAVENLKNSWVPLYVRTPGDGKGNAALVANGALPFTWMPSSTDTLISVFGDRVATSAPFAQQHVDAQQSLLPLEPVLAAEATNTVSQGDSSQGKLIESSINESANVQLVIDDAPSAVSAPNKPSATLSAPTEKPQVAAPVTSLDMYADFSFKLKSLLCGKDLSEDQIGTFLCLEKAQAKAWLKRASEDGLVEKLKRPVRYIIKR